MSNKLHFGFHICNMDSTDFTLDNLPYGVFSVPPNQRHRVGVAFGDKVLDLCKVKKSFDGPLMKDHQDVFEAPVLNPFMGLSHLHWSEARATIKKLLGNPDVLPEDALVPMKAVQMHLPANIGDYTDFYSSIDHATNVGTMFRYSFFFSHSIYPRVESAKE